MFDPRKMMEEAQKKEQLRHKDEIVEVMVRIMSAVYDKAVAYTNLIIIAGYVTFFTAWGKMFEILPRFYIGLSGLLMALSALFFISWEIGKMISLSLTMKRFIKLIDQKDSRVFHDNLMQYQYQEQKRNVRNSRTWFIFLALTIIPAATAASLLLFSYTKYVFQMIK